MQYVTSAQMMSALTLASVHLSKLWTESTHRPSFRCNSCRIFL